MQKNLLWYTYDVLGKRSVVSGEIIVYDFFDVVPCLELKLHDVHTDQEEADFMDSLYNIDDIDEFDIRATFHLSDGAVLEMVGSGTHNYWREFDGHQFHRYI